MPKVNGLYTGLEYSVYSLDNEVSTADDYLQGLVDDNKVDSVVGITVMPSILSDYSGHASEPVEIGITINRINVFNPNDGSSGGSYTPRNKKLLCYPFKFLSVDTLCDSKEYRFEYSKDKTSIDFRVLCALSPNPEIIIAPRNYNGRMGNDSFNACESVTLSGFPQCAFTIDTYRAWLAQSAIPDVAGIVGTTIASAGVAAGAAEVAGTAIAATSTGLGAAAMTVAAPICIVGVAAVGVIGAVESLIKKATKGNKARGSQGCSTLTAAREYIPHFRHMSILPQQAKILDDYFDRYGYVCGRLKIPNRNVRPHWTYTKTQAVNITGNIPTNDLDKIKSIYNNGITFWKNGYEVGLYNLDNRVN